MRVVAADIEEVYIDPDSTVGMRAQGAGGCLWLGKDMARILGIKPGWKGTLIAVEHPEPKEKRKECAKVKQRCGQLHFCETCGYCVGVADACPDCHSFFTHTIPWAEFRKDC